MLINKIRVRYRVLSTQFTDLGVELEAYNRSMKCDYDEQVYIDAYSHFCQWPLTAELFIISCKKSNESLH